ncbi:MAG: iron-sulfur cluster assembly scaffold protein [Dehalococcoidia bacterium]|nr:iron-sulfur cluster assembly scaffold protein [Dehalococcoidia bacterium]MDD5493389.1 iron-sulfur cluster assembly scaffold protein [Dehalococcoidia bacterium]
MEEKFDKLDEYVLGNPQGNYSRTYLEHALHPRNVGNLEGANGFAAVSGHDGNVMEIWLKINDDTVEDASFWTDGCGTTIACGSITTDIIKGKNIEQVLGIDEEYISSALDGLPGEGCVCARLAADTLKAAVLDYITFRNEPWRRKYTRT